ncbi:MAG: hypothetical protein AAGL49_07525 [Pseudomonadota bacterium]
MPRTIAQTLTAPIARRFILASMLAVASALAGASHVRAEQPTPQAGGLAYGECFSGVTDRVYAYGPPNWSFVAGRSAGAFLDCGEGRAADTHDDFGQTTLELVCGVTLSETVSIPQVGPKARIVIHY